ncbi:MAG: hypothetical protein ACRD30_04840 [Bryobacteraceae bacterium]
MGISLVFISFFDYETFSGWISYALMCGIPMQIVVSVTWHGNHPAFAAPLRQPHKGASLLLLTIVIGAIVCVAYFETVGGGINPPAPMLIMCTIVTVIITFWLTFMFAAWPFNRLIKHPVAAGLTLLAAVYVVSDVLFRIFFDFGFMRGAPVYAPALDPHGIFNAWSALVFFVAASAAMFLMLNFELWPLTKIPAIMRQPVLGIVWTVVVLAITGAGYYIGVDMIGMDPVEFMIKVPIPFIFGTIVTHNMFQGSLVPKKVGQPLKGILATIATVVAGGLLAWLFGTLAPHITGALKSGPPAYDYEIWLASALLAVTFPFLIFYAEFFKLWPLAAIDRAESAAPKMKNSPGSTRATA